MAGTRSRVLAAGSSRALYEAWTEHPHFRYRGCAPDPDAPTRLAGDPRLPLDTHFAADGDKPETPAERIAREDAAIEVCLGCPVMVQCDAYANSVVVGEDGTARLAEPDGVRGGRTALERHRAFIARRHEVSTVVDDARLRTPQKLAVVAALAVVWDPYEVADRAGLDVRTSNWQRSSLVRLLGLPKTVSRERLLEEARRHGLLEGDFVRDGGGVRALAPPTPAVRPGGAPAVTAPVAAVVTPSPAPAPEPGPVSAAVSAPASRPQGDLERPREGETADSPPPGRTRVPSPRRSWFTAVPGQLDFDDLADWLDTTSSSLTPTPAYLEAAA
ncbi:hypothetical protein [Streptomyces chilikensis]|uniref:4Fe-4S Wbl-type domain-containing protein n=1 Tax=Streptomyces chilikensis TaxID=1194079 RepID=A0ABV3ERD8_9ACTN